MEHKCNKERHLEAAGGRVLIAEDEDDFRKLLTRHAFRHGLQIVQAADGECALAAVQQHPFGVLVLDIYLPSQTDLEVLRAGLEKDPDVQAIMLTAQASIETAVEALRAGAYDYLTKPLDSFGSSICPFPELLSTADC